MKDDRGLIHLYYGDGKGKTTAGMGQVIRFAGHGKKALVVQFLKSGNSGEIEMLRALGVDVLAKKEGSSFVKDMTAKEKAANRKNCDEMLSAVLESDAELVLLDELCGAVEYDLADEALAKKVVLEKPVGREIIITGRHPAAWMLESADYITNMCAVRHPADKGIMAREGIEY